MRRDLLPAAYIDELELLHDNLPAMGIDVVRATIEGELGAPLTELFSSSGAFTSRLRAMRLSAGEGVRYEGCGTCCHRCVERFAGSCRCDGRLRASRDRESSLHGKITQASTLTRSL